MNAAPTVVLGPLRPEHLDAVLDIERRSFGSPWTRAHFEEELAGNAGAEPRVLLEDGRVAAYACVSYVLDELHIDNVAVDPERRGRGHAARLIGALLEEARARGCVRATLEVRAGNERALALYAGFGFREVGRRRGYYEAEREDALLMDCDLRPKV